MRAIFGQGTPKGMADALVRLIFGLLNLLAAIFAPSEPQGGAKQTVNSGLPYLSMAPVSG
jgi:hypothetical protein